MGKTKLTEKKQSKTATLNVRMNPDIKRDAENILNELGISPSSAIDMFYRQVINEKGIPFEIKLPDDHELNISSKTIDEINDLLDEGLRALDSGRTFSIDEVREHVREASKKYE